MADLLYFVDLTLEDIRDYDAARARNRAIDVLQG